jgi:hypothetical protein
MSYKAAGRSEGEGKRRGRLLDRNPLPKLTPPAAVGNLSEGGSLAESLSGAEAATADDNQKRVEESPAIETDRPQ